MNMFRFIRCLKNDVRVCSMFDKMVFDTSLSIATQVTNLYQKYLHNLKGAFQDSKSWQTQNWNWLNKWSKTRTWPRSHRSWQWTCKRKQWSIWQWQLLTWIEKCSLFRYNMCLKNPAVWQRNGGNGPIRTLRQSIPQLMI